MATYVITEACVGVKDATCVEVCPVACIHTTAEAPQYYIDPDVCIACEQCVLVCPVKAIYLDEEVPSDQAHSIQINADFFQQNKPPPLPVTTEQARAIIDAAKNFASARAQRVAIAVVDSDGIPILVEAMDSATENASDLAFARAYCSARLQVPTHELPRDLPSNIGPGGRVGTVSIPKDFDLTRLVSGLGGFPIAEEISVLGAIGVAGADSGDLDMQCCHTGITALMAIRQSASH
jgi:uncharacterized protein GlcG (DUF336 family)/NAD-dependent dihydropyrimidine dehydrogenase PreA subunit